MGTTKGKTKKWKKEIESVYVGKFNCKVPVKFLERCEKCPRKDKCTNRKLLLDILSGKKKLVYD